MPQTMTEFFLSAFRFDGLTTGRAFIAIGLGMLFGAIWLAPYRPPLLKRRLLWAVLAVGAFLTWAAIAFVQVPLQTWAGRGLLLFWDRRVLVQWLLLAGIPQVLVSGLVQEGAKLAPVVAYWAGSGRDLSARAGLVAGAVAGAGFGVFEAVWVHNTILASGWGWQTVQAQGYLALLGFWERFFTVGFHIAVSAIAGYGLARGMGWQFYLIASGLHAAANYSVVLIQARILTAVQTEIFIGILAVAVTVLALWLRQRSGVIDPARPPTG